MKPRRSKPVESSTTATMADAPTRRTGAGPLRRVFDRLERKIGLPMEQVVATSTFTELMIRGVHLQLAAGQLVERVSNDVWHLLNLPTRSDLAWVSRQIASLESDVRKLAEEQRSVGAGTAPDQVALPEAIVVEDGP